MNDIEARRAIYCVFNRGLAHIVFFFAEPKELDKAEYDRCWAGESTPAENSPVFEPKAGG